MKLKTARHLLIAGLVALPIMMTSTAADAESCRNGSCGGPSAAEQVVSMAERSMAAVRNDSLESAYDQITTVAAHAEEQNVASLRAVRESIRDLVSVLQQRTDDQFDTAMSNYFEGYHAQALEQLNQLAELDGLPAARNAQRELDKEDNRSAWREARDLVTEQVGSGDYGAALDAFNEVQRLARRTDYTEQTRTLMSELAEQMLEQVQVAEGLIADGQYERAYTMLADIRLLSHARESAIAARRVLSEHATDPGIREARGEYEAQRALAAAQGRLNEHANPTTQEQERYLRELNAIIASFPGTRAANQAQQLLDPQADQQASR